MKDKGIHVRLSRSYLFPNSLSLPEMPCFIFLELFIVMPQKFLPVVGVGSLCVLLLVIKYIIQDQIFFILSKLESRQATLSARGFSCAFINKWSKAVLCTEAQEVQEKPLAPSFYYNRARKSQPSLVHSAWLPHATRVSYKAHYLTINTNIYLLLNLRAIVD